MRDERCTRSACPEQARCDDSTGRIVCECLEGYTGDDCDVCSAGYHDRDGTCVLDEICTADSCSGHGECDDSEGVAVCSCEPGFTGARCSKCAAGFYAVVGGCAEKPTCRADSCSNHGQCSEGARELLCACDEGYAGERCEVCDADFTREGDTCVPLPPEASCTAATCAGNGTCDNSSGVAVCDCQPGYGGARCGSCATGYVKDARGRCVVSSCGDGIIDPRSETCDDGNTVTEECPYETSDTPCSVCRSDCQVGPGIPNYCGDGDLDSDEECDEGGESGACTAECKLKRCPFTLTQTSDEVITPFNSFACTNPDGYHFDSEYLRAFDLGSLGIQRFDVTDVRIGIEFAGNSPQLVTVRIYSTDSDLSSMTLIEEVSYNVAPMSLSFITVPIEASVEGPLGTHLAASLFTPTGFIWNKLRIGSNAEDETADGYLKAPGCGLDAFTPLADIGYSDMNMLIDVQGSAIGPACDP